MNCDRYKPVVFQKKTHTLEYLPQQQSKKKCTHVDDNGPIKLEGKFWFDQKTFYSGVVKIISVLIEFCVCVCVWLTGGSFVVWFSCGKKEPRVERRLVNDETRKNVDAEQIINDRKRFDGTQWTMISLHFFSATLLQFVTLDCW